MKKKWSQGNENQKKKDKKPPTTTNFKKQITTRSYYAILYVFVTLMWSMIYDFQFNLIDFWMFSRFQSCNQVILYSFVLQLINQKKKMREVFFFCFNFMHTKQRMYILLANFSLKGWETKNKNWKRDRWIVKWSWGLAKTVAKSHKIYHIFPAKKLFSYAEPITMWVYKMKLSSINVVKDLLKSLYSLENYAVCKDSNL